MSDAAWQSEKRNKGKEKNKIADSQMLSLDYRKVSFKLSLIGSDDVVKSMKNPAASCRVSKASIWENSCYTGKTHPHPVPPLEGEGIFVILCEWLWLMGVSLKTSLNMSRIRPACQNLN